MLELEKNLVSYMSSCDENSPKREKSPKRRKSADPDTLQIELSKLKHTDKL